MVADDSHPLELLLLVWPIKPDHHDGGWLSKDITSSARAIENLWSP